MAATTPTHGRRPGRRGGAHRRVDSGTTQRRRRRLVTRRAWTLAARWLGGDRRGPTGTSEKVSADGGARNAVARRTHRSGGVDDGVDGFGYDDDGFGLGDGVASDSGGQDGEAKRRGMARRAVRSDIGCPNDAVRAVFKTPGAFGHRRPQQPIRARRGATLPLTAGPHASAVFRI
jgi:hypothetical protein